MKVYYTITLETDPTLYQRWVKEAKALGFKSLEKYINYKIKHILSEELPNE